MPSRDEIIGAMRAALEPESWVNAMWLAGSDAMGSTDDLSDVDAVVDVADGRHVDAFELIESALEQLAPIELRYHIPEPAWHGHSQRFYRLAGCPEHLMVDLCVMQRNADAPRFDEREIHGVPLVLFDKLGVIVARPVDRSAHREAIRAFVSSLETRFQLFRHLAVKEVPRGNQLDALWRYQKFVLTPLTSILRVRYAPMFYDFSPRYLARDLPPDVYQRLMRLSYVGSFDALEATIAEAIAWIEAELAALDIDSIELPPPDENQS